MKINIKKFMELANIEFETPVKIEAAHDVGKSTIFRAVLFAITGKDVDGMAFDGKIYPKTATTLSDLNVEVEIEQSGVIFNKKSRGSEKREKGQESTELIRNVNITYSINNDASGGKKAYEEKIQEVFGNFQLFCNPDYFRNLKTNEEKRKIFLPLVNIDKSTYFDGLPEKIATKGRRDKQKEEIDKQNAKLEELKQIQEPEKIEFVDYALKLAELRSQRQNTEPKFTPDQLSHNDRIQNAISQLENSVFVPEEMIPFLPEVEKPKLIDVDELKKELEKIQLSEPDTNFIDTRIKQFNEKIATIKALQLQIENYDENVKNAKCTLCQVCTAPDCQFKKIEIMSKGELEFHLSKYDPIETAEKSLENLESQKIDYLRDFESNKDEEILRMQNEISVAETKNIEDLMFYRQTKDLNDKLNDDATRANSKILSKNSASIANFETEKAKKIAELKGKIHSLPAFDYSEIDREISEIEEKQREQQKAIDTYNKALGSFEHAHVRISILEDEIEKMKQVLFAHERELIAIEKAENSYYNDFENLINSEMPENIRVSLFKKNLSNDGYSEVFEIEFNGSIYAGNGKTIAFYIWLCGWFQSKFEKSLPIFIDEAIILNESLYSEVKNTVILMRNDNCKQLKITNVNS